MSATAEKPANVPAIAKPALASGGKIMAIVPDSFDSAFRLARVIADSGAWPKSFGDYDKATGRTDVNTSRIAVAIMHGMEVGLTPMAAIQSIAVINGMPTIYGDGAIGLVQASGMLEDIEETVESDKDGPLIAKCRVKRRDRQRWVEQTFTRVEAQKANLWSKERSPWLTYPRRMMQMRARSWALRDAFPDVLRGLAIREEIEDMVDVTERGSHTMTPPPEPQRADFKAQTPVTDVEDPPSPDAGPATAGNGDAPAVAASSQPTPAGDAEPRDWKIPGDVKFTDARVQAFRDLFAAAETHEHVGEIQQQNAAIIGAWASAKPGSAQAQALDAVHAMAREAEERLAA